MKFDFSTPGCVIVTMIDYVKEVLAAFDEIAPNESGTKSCAAPKDLFVVDKDCPKLQPSKAVAFHNLTAKILFATKCARLDTCTSVAFLTTRVRKPNKDDWHKLCHLMMYL